MLPDSPLYPAGHIVDKPSPLEQRADQIFVDNLIAGNTRPKQLLRLWTLSLQVPGAAINALFQMEIRPDFWIVRVSHALAAAAQTSNFYKFAQQGGDTQTIFIQDNSASTYTQRRVYPGTADTLVLKSITDDLAGGPGAAPFHVIEVAAVIGYNTQDVL